MPLQRHSRRFLLALPGAVLALGLSAVASAEAAPRLVSAGAVDADSDGSVDAFNLRFSAPVRGRAQSRGPFSLAIAGYRVVRVGRPSGRRVTVGVAEAPGCDLGARPKVSYRPRGRAGALTDAHKRPLRRSKLDTARRDRGAPRITCAVTSDSDRNGHVDAVVLTYSKPVRNRAQTAGRFAFQVDRFALRSVDRARGRYLTLRVRERSAFDTDALPAVIYRAPRKGAERRYAVLAGRARAADATFNATRDRSPAMLLSTRTADSDADGLVDAVEGRFSEPVRAGEGSVEVAGGRVTGVAAGERQTLVARLAEGPFGSAARPATTWGTARSDLRDAGGNVSARATATPADGAAPVLTSAQTEDRGGLAGRLDTVTVRFSEPVSHPADSDGTYPFGVTGYSIALAGAASGDKVELTLKEGPESDSGVRPPVGYTRGAEAAVRDLAGNEAVSRAFAGVTDRVLPRLLGAQTVDADLDGRLDAVSFEFSEPVKHSARACPDCSFEVTGGGLVAESAGAAAGSAVSVAVTEPASGYNSGLRPTASYSPVGGGVTDSSGNTVAAATVAAAKDGAPPVAVAAETADASSNGRIDRLLATFSEQVSLAADASAPFSLGAAGYDVASVDAASGSSIALRLVEKGAPDTGSAPALSYDAARGEALTDANGTEHASRSYPGLTRDAVAPVFVGAKTADVDAQAGDQPGRIDAIDLVFSEQLQGSNAPGAFVVPGRTVEAVSYAADRVSLRLAEAGAPDTAVTTAFDYTPPGAPGDPARLRDLAEGPGDAEDAAGPLSGPVGDGAGPAVVSARTADDDADGYIDAVDVALSEDALVAPGAPPPLTIAAPTLTVSTVARPTNSAIKATVEEPAGAPVGDLEPSVTLAPGRVADGAGNPARTPTFSATVDGVRPKLLGGRSGEQAGAGCESAPVNGIVDCVRADWSEPVQAPSGVGAFTLSPFDLSGVLVSPAPESTDLAVQEGPDADRNRSGSLDYAAGSPEQVLDLAGNPALSGHADLRRACIDTALSEPNDARASDNYLLSDPVPLQALCAGDEDWFRVDSASGALDLLVDPRPGLATTIELVDAAGATVAGPVTSAAPGQPVELHRAGLPAGTYWLHVNGTFPQEGAYCIDVTPSPGEGCNEGGGLPT